MKERLKELGYWLEGKLKDFCGEITPDKRLIIIAAMLLILTAGNIYLTSSTIYNLGKENEKKNRPDIEHIKRPRPDKRKHRVYDFIDSEINMEQFDMYKQKIRKDSFDSINSNKQNFKEYEWENKNKYGAKTKA